MNNQIQQRSYEKYTSLFNKVCSSILFLIISILTTAISIANILNLFDVISTGNILSILFALLPALFITLTMIGLWILYVSALKKNISGSTFGLVKCYPKFNQIIKTIATIILIIAIIGLLIGLYSLKSELEEALEEDETSIEEIKSEFNNGLNEALGEETMPQEIVDLIDKFFDKIDYYLGTGLVIITVIFAVIVLFLIFELIRCSMLVKLLSSASNMYLTGRMTAPPSMFFCILNYIFAIISIIGSIITIKPFGSVITINLFEFNWIMFITGVVQALIGVTVMINRKELKDVYSNWKAETGMINAPVQVAFNNGQEQVPNYVATQQYAPQPIPQQTVQVDNNQPSDNSESNDINSVQ